MDGIKTATENIYTFCTQTNESLHIENTSIQKFTISRSHISIPNSPTLLKNSPPLHPQNPTSKTSLRPKVHTKNTLRVKVSRAPRYTPRSTRHRPKFTRRQPSRDWRSPGARARAHTGIAPSCKWKCGGRACAAPAPRADDAQPGDFNEDFSARASIRSPGLSVFLPGAPQELPAEKSLVLIGCLPRAGEIIRGLNIYYRGRVGARRGYWVIGAGSDWLWDFFARRKFGLRDAVRWWLYRLRVRCIAAGACLVFFNFNDWNEIDFEISYEMVE